MVDGINLNNLNVDPNTGRVSFSGLSSGIDLQGTVDAIIAAKHIPIDNLQTKVQENTDKISALKDLKTNLEALQSSLSKLYGQVSFGNANDIFAGKQAYASTSRQDGLSPSAVGNLLGVTVDNSASAGNHTVQVLQTAKAHKISSDQITDKSAALGFADGDQFTITTNQYKKTFQSSVTSASTDPLGSNGTLEFTDNEGNVIGTVAYASTDTISDLATNISNNVTGVTATIENTTGGVRLKLSSSTAFRMSETGAGSALTDFQLGVIKVNVNSATSLVDLRDLINQANTGATATGVSASVVTVTASESYLVLTGSSTGVTMTLANTSGTPLDTVGILDGSNAIKNQLQAAQSAKLYADGILDQSNTSYESDLQSASTVQIGSAGTLSFNSGALGTVNYTANMTLQDLADAITTNITGVTGSVVTDGAGVRLQITGSAAFDISETGGGTAIADLGIDNSRKVITRSTNTITDLFSGVTLSLYAAEKGTDISLDVEEDLSQVKQAISTFVDSYNALRQFYNGQRLRDSSTGAISTDAGPLSSSTALEQVGTALSQIVGAGVPGADESYTVLSQIGVNFVSLSQDDPLKANNLEIDETKLDSVLQSNPDDVRKLFSFDFTSSDPRVSLLNFTRDTQYNAAGYTLNVAPTGNTTLNGFEYSDQIDNAYWTKSEVSIDADSAGTLAPDGTNTADGVIGSTNNTWHSLTPATQLSITAGQSYIFSTYVKAGDKSDVRLQVNGTGFGGAIRAHFDLATGTVKQTVGAVDATSVQDVGNGWYRISMKVTGTANGSSSFERYVEDPASYTYAGDGSTVNAYFWGAQVEDVTTETSPGTYVPTTSAPSIDNQSTANIDGASSGVNDGSVTASGSTLTVNTGNAKGLQVFFNGLSSTSSIHLDFTVGLGAQMFFKIGDLLDTATGIVEGEIDELSSQNDLNNQRITEMTDRLDLQRQNLMDHYIKMETALSTANNIMQSVKQQAAALSGTKSGN